MKINTTQRI